LKLLGIANVRLRIGRRKRRRLAGRVTGKLGTAPKFNVQRSYRLKVGMSGTSSDLGTSHLAENIFEVPQEHGHLSVFVNYGFALDRPERSDSFATMFWQQLAPIFEPVDSIKLSGKTRHSDSVTLKE
jgi:hypothetical protein